MQPNGWGPQPPQQNPWAPPGGPWAPQQQAYACARCGAPGADYFPPRAPALHRQCAGLGPDTLTWPWILLAYGITIPLGYSCIGALVASIPYYVWRAQYPQKAKPYNRHVWIAFAISCALYALAYVARRR